MDYIGYVLLGSIIILGIWVMISSRVVKWYKVYLANNDIILLKRGFKERWWRTSDRYMRFANEYGKEVTFPSSAHWILMMEELSTNELDVVREEIQRLREQKAKEKADED